MASPAAPQRPPGVRARRAAMVSFTTSERSDELVTGAVLLDMFHDPATSQYYAYTRLARITACADTERQLRATYADVRDVVHGAAYDKWLNFMALNFPLGRGDGREGPLLRNAPPAAAAAAAPKKRQKRRNDDFEGGALLQRAPAPDEVMRAAHPTMSAFERRRRAYGEHGERFAALVAEYSALPVPPAEALARAAMAAQWTGAFSVHRGMSAAPAADSFATLYARYKKTAAAAAPPSSPSPSAAAVTPTKPNWDPCMAGTLLVDVVARLATDRTVERARDCLADLTQHNRQGAALLREALMRYDAAGYMGGRAMAEEARAEHGAEVERLLRRYTTALDGDGVYSAPVGWTY